MTQRRVFSVFWCSAFSCSASLMVGSIVLGSLVAGCSNSPPPEPAPSRPVPVRTVAVMQQDVKQTSTQPATVEPYYTAEIRARISGYVHEIKADIGDFVEAGAPLAVIEVPELEKQKETLQARLVRLKAEEKRATAGVSLAEANVTAAEALVEEAKSKLQSSDALLAAAEAEFKRVNDLVERRTLENRLLDEARKKRDAELANKQSVQSSVHSADANVLVAEAQKESAEADLAAAQAETSIAQKQLEELDVRLGFAELKAPFPGVVTARSVDPGDLVQEGTAGGHHGQPLFVVSQIDKVRVQTLIPEADAAFVNTGDSMTLTFPSFSGEQLTAKVSRLAQSLDMSTRTMLVEAEFENKDRKLLPGMFGQATVALATKTASNVLPARAIRFDENGKAYVYVVGTDDKVTVVDVSTGIDDGISIEILQGLESGQRVVDAHLQRLTTGQVVTVLPQ